MQLEELEIADGSNRKLACAVLLSDGSAGERLPKVFTVGRGGKMMQWRIQGGDYVNVRHNVLELVKGQEVEEGFEWRLAFGTQVWAAGRCAALPGLPVAFPLAYWLLERLPAVCCGCAALITHTTPAPAAACSTWTTGRCWCWAP